jgi:hypothetical protein
MGAEEDASCRPLFSKVLYKVIFHSKCTRALTCENFVSGKHRQRARNASGGVCVCVCVCVFVVRGGLYSQKSFTFDLHGKFTRAPTFENFVSGSDG